MGLVLDRLLAENHQNIITQRLEDPDILYDYWELGFRPRLNGAYLVDVPKSTAYDGNIITPIRNQCTIQQHDHRNWTDCIDRAALANMNNMQNDWIVFYVRRNGRGGPVRVCVCVVGCEWGGLSRADDDGLLPAACVAQKAWSSNMGTQQHQKQKHGTKATRLNRQRVVQPVQYTPRRLCIGRSISK